MHRRVYRRKRVNLEALQRRRAEQEAVSKGVEFLGTAVVLGFMGRVAQPGGLMYEAGRELLEKQAKDFLVGLAMYAVS